MRHLIDNRKLGIKEDAFKINFPHSICMFALEYRGLHPTQKLIKLLEHLIKLYSNKSDHILDFISGSGSCGVAAYNTEREFLGIEKDNHYYKISKKFLWEQRLITNILRTVEKPEIYNKLTKIALSKFEDKTLRELKRRLKERGIKWKIN